MRKLTDEERIYRRNYAQRVFAGVIPKRNSWDDFALQNLTEWWQFDGKVFHDCYFNNKTGLFEMKLRKVGTLDGLPEAEIQSNHWYLLNHEYWEGYDKEILEKTNLSLPTSDRCFPPPVRATQREKQKFIKRCPSYLLLYIDKLFKD